MKRADRRRDAFTLAAAALLLALGAGLFWLWTERARERRDLALQGVPDFPRPGQQVVNRRAPITKAAPAPKAAPATPAPAPALPPRPQRDRLAGFALAPTKSVAVLQINALFNTPLWSRFKECTPEAAGTLAKFGDELGLDLERDLDRVAIVPGGMAISGFFEGKPVAERMAGPAAAKHDYRGQTLYDTGRSCFAQLGTLVVTGGAGDCERLTDRALDGEAGPDASQELYGDVYARTELKDLRKELGVDQVQGDVFATLLKQLDGATLRANVWDQVAVSLDGVPADQGNAADLAKMARAAITLAKTQIGEDDVELRALADLAKVHSEDGKLKLDVAMSVDDLFDKLHLPCPGKDGLRPDAGMK